MMAGEGSRRAGTFARRRRKDVPLRRRLGLGATLVLALALVAGGAYWALHTSVFAVTRIETGSYRFTAPETLDGALGVFLGRNLLRVGRGAVEDSLADLPWVRDVHIQRRLPGSLIVDFREWRPLAVVAGSAGESADVPRLLAENGQILTLPPAMQVPALPTLSGLAAADDSLTVAGLLDLFQAVATSGLETVAAVDFVVVEPEGYAIVLAAGQGRLQLGRKEFGPRLQRYLTARPHLEPGLVVDLRFADRVTVRRRESTGHGRS